MQHAYKQRLITCLTAKLAGQSNVMVGRFRDILLALQTSTAVQTHPSKIDDVSVSEAGVLGTHSWMLGFVELCRERGSPLSLGGYRRAGGVFCFESV